MLLLWAWAEQWQGEEQTAEQPDEVEYETRRVLTELTALHATRYYFALIKLIPSQVRPSLPRMQESRMLLNDKHLTLRNHKGVLNVMISVS